MKPITMLLAVALPSAAPINQHWGSFGLSLVNVEGTSSEVSDTGTSLVLDDGLGATFGWTWSFSRRFSLAVGLTLARHDIETDAGLFADLVRDGQQAAERPAFAAAGSRSEGGGAAASWFVAHK